MDWELGKDNGKQTFYTIVSKWP